MIGLTYVAQAVGTVVALVAAFLLMPSVPAARRPRRRKVRNPFKAGRIGHVKRGIAYHVGNSLRGLRLMKRFGKRWADRDVQMTLDGILVNCHWPRPGIKDGFIRGWRGKPRSTPIDHLTWAEVSALRTLDGYRIRRLADDIADMGRLRMGAYFEPKGDPRLKNQHVWDYVKDLCDAHGVPARGYALPQNAGALPFMRAAGIPSHQLRAR